jgi:two-component system nitrogen regulation response regulator GlnG
MAAVRRGRGREGAGLPTWARTLADSVPALGTALRAAGEPRMHRTVLGLLERPLLEHALAETGGNQLRAARLLGLNRNTLRKRCRALGLAPTARPRAPAGTTAA